MLTETRFPAQNEVKVDPQGDEAPEYQSSRAHNSALARPDVESLAESLKGCLQESEDVPSDFTASFDHKMLSFDQSLIPEVVDLHQRLNVKNELLTLIPPQFEVPLPNLQPAIFQPSLRELPPPSLELFDLDQEFASEKERLAQLANKCTDSESDLAYFISQAGDILHVAPQADGKSHFPFSVLAGSDRGDCVCSGQESESQDHLGNDAETTGQLETNRASASIRSVCKA